VKDDDLLAASTATMITGKQGTVLNAFPGGQRRARSIGKARCCYRERRSERREDPPALGVSSPVTLSISISSLYMAITSAQTEDMTKDAKATNTDFLNALKPKWSDDGKYLDRPRRFRVQVEIELGNPLFQNAGLTLDVNGYRKVIPFWSADGMVMATWEELFTSVDKLPTKHFSAQVYSRCQQVASRTDNNRCGYVLCVES
jgi:hypothetical protein